MSIGFPFQEGRHPFFKLFQVSSLTLPDDFYIPAKRSKRPDRSPVAGSIRCNLGFPKVLSRFGELAVFAAVPVPEAAVNQYNLVQAGKYDIGFARQGFDVKPITIAQAMSQPSDPEFGAGVPAAHRSHYGSALFGCSCVGHWVDSAILRP